ncbi:group II intron reverse transcriptase/maturase [Argonema galeatum]|uniref:group II intron reverse transcriptase/maturase n=1 Tax=Argonema galeatum TaxID=2942762 RepID=UPI002010FBE0
MAKVAWKQLNWKKIEKAVFKLQKHIYRASQSGNVKLVRRLQKLLSKSYYAKCLAVRRVTQDNSGKKTAGIDGAKSLNYSQRTKLINTLDFTSKVSPLRRVWIPKPGTDSKRGLGIPTIRDRATQMLAKLVIEPEWEAFFESNSYGFRPGRNCHDAIDAIFKQISMSAEKWVLDADFAKCFDNISHAQLLKKCRQFPALQRQLKAWLKAGVMDGLEFSETPTGTPKGGVISPLLANIALHGMEEYVDAYWRQNLRGKSNSRYYYIHPKLVRYADDFVILHPQKEVIEALKQVIEIWAKNEIGLELNESKTKIRTTSEGFNFLGNNIRQYKVGKYRAAKNCKENLGHNPLIKPTKEKVLKHLEKIGKAIKKHQNSHQAVLIKELNPIIRGWCNYYSPVSAKETFSSCDYQVWLKLRSWARKKGKGSINKDKYWRNGWNFETEDGFKLAKHSDTPIIRHIKVQDSRSPFDGDWTYWGQRLSEYNDLTSRKQKLLKRQKGQCSHCGLYFHPDDLTEIDHRKPRVEGGKDTYDNLDLLHKHCHDEKTATDIERQNLEGIPSKKTNKKKSQDKKVVAGVNHNDQ